MRCHALALSSLLLLTACAKQSLSVSGSYIRAPVANRDVTAAFMTIANNTQTDIALQSASSPAASKVELHQHTHSDGMMRMRQVDQIDIPAQSTVALEPGGYHMMLIGITATLLDQQSVDISLEFSNGDTLTVPTSVRSVLAEE